MELSAVQRKWAFSWRAFVCAGLVLAYLGFVGEAIHCQYLPATSEHQGHGGSSSKPLNHATHCLVANHGTTATIHSAEVTGTPPTQRFGFLFTPGDASYEPGVVFSTSARGPPSA
jgi:hypothetical protein